ncbi:hypothetical protein [uncultured Lutibacter sp.]|uniref:hypothetical protein n=1 Tax=uncultured Lutibacter sp. TaxID=437739 RepID=UPI0026197196|nr:hypothetical protein [uncultured Lutibacter sp.]
MKNRLIFLFLLFAIVTLNSCYQKSQTVVITDFSNSIIDTLKAKKSGHYGAAIMEIEGHSNDTIIISFYNFKRKFSGNFKKSINMDFYGGLNSHVIFKFNPYKATSGEIKVKYGIY